MSIEAQFVAPVMRFSLSCEDLEGKQWEQLYETQGEALVAAMEMLEGGIGRVKVMVKRVRRVP